jgi:hypothetical protein
MAVLGGSGAGVMSRVRALVAWTQLFGRDQLRGVRRFEGVVEDPEVLFEHAVTVMGTVVGLRSAAPDR